MHIPIVPKSSKVKLVSLIVALTTDHKKAVVDVTNPAMLPHIGTLENPTFLFCIVKPPTNIKQNSKNNSKGNSHGKATAVPT